MIKIAVPIAIILLAISALMWRSYLRETGSGTYDEAPELWAGAPGSTGGPHGEIYVPALADNASSTLGVADCLALAGTAWTGTPPPGLSEPDVMARGKQRAAVIWFSAVRLDDPPSDGHPIAHLKCQLLPNPTGNGMIIAKVSLLGSLGIVAISSDASDAQP